MYLSINPDNPEGRKIKQVVEALEQGGVVIYPTDTVYGMGCDITNKQAVERIARLRGLDPSKALFSIICQDISQVTEYTTPISNDVFRVMRHNLPGPFTFVLNGNNRLPKVLKNRKETIGVRIPDNNIVLEIVKQLGRPILTASLKADDEISGYFTDPRDIYDDYQKLVDIVIDGGLGGNVPSTIIDCTGEMPVMEREGAGTLKE